MQMSAMKGLLSNCRVQLILCKDNAFMGYIQKYCLNFDKKSLRLSRAGGMIKEKCKEVKEVKEFQMWKWISLSHLRVSKQGQALRTPGRSQ